MVRVRNAGAAGVFVVKKVFVFDILYNLVSLLLVLSSLETDRFWLQLRNPAVRTLRIITFVGKLQIHTSSTGALGL